MNIKDAKTEIQNTIQCYLTKDEFGNYTILPVHQRPMFLLGPPGIGKTAIMEQVASEMGINLLSYSMTHHTRQSAMGLPFIVHKNYGDETFDITEYTMSEIIASVYEKIDKTGISEGILFLDEINCVSETLSPIMLQFLQYKVFGRHHVPEGWVIVTAGNPPEYNRSVTEYDIATWDRLQKIEVEPVFSVWKEYASDAGVHPSIMTYLSIKEKDFYRVENTVNGKQFVTARSWEDLSKIIYLYEMKNFTVNQNLTDRFLQSAEISKSFHIYYDLYNKYKSDYQIDDIVAGKESEEIVRRASDAQFDERLTLVSLILERIRKDLCKTVDEQENLLKILEILKNNKPELSKSGTAAHKCLQKVIKQLSSNYQKRVNTGAVMQTEKRSFMLLKSGLESIAEEVEKIPDSSDSFAVIKEMYNKQLSKMKKDVATVKDMLENGFSFMEKAFSQGNELLVFVTELTTNTYCSKFISKFGCDSYYKYNKSLLIHERNLEIDRIIDSLNLL